MISILWWGRGFALVPSGHMHSIQILGHLFQFLLFTVLLKVKQLHLSFKPPTLLSQLLVLPTLLLKLREVSKSSLRMGMD